MGGGWGDIILKGITALALVRLATSPRFLGSDLATSLGPGGELLASVGGEFHEVLIRLPLHLNLLLGRSLHLF